MTEAQVPLRQLEVDGKPKVKSRKGRFIGLFLDKTKLIIPAVVILVLLIIIIVLAAVLGHEQAKNRRDTPDKTQTLKKVKILLDEVNELKQLVAVNQTFVKLNTDPVCFGTTNDSYGEFQALKGGKLRKVKLVHLYGYVTCAKPSPIYWSHWGCGLYKADSDSTDFIIVALTDESNTILFPPSQLGKGALGWVLVPGYNSYSPELVMSIYDAPVSVTAGQKLRLWYLEDLNKSYHSDNDGKACADIYGEFM